MEIKINSITGYGFITNAEKVHETARVGMKREQFPTIKECQNYFMKKHSCFVHPFKSRDDNKIHFLVATNSSIVRPSIDVVKDSYAAVCTEKMPYNDDDIQKQWCLALLNVVKDMGIKEASHPGVTWYTIVTTDWKNLVISEHEFEFINK